MAGNKGEIITFKVNQALLDALQGIENRSEFIRSAVIGALEGTCPLCRGTGRLTPNQKTHWQALEIDHAVQECGECHEVRLVCSHGRRRSPHARKRK